MTDSGFRIEGDPKLRITTEEIEAQRKAQEKLQDRMRRDNKIRDVASNDLDTAARYNTEKYRGRTRASENVRAGLDPNMRLPDDAELAEIRDQDPDTAHLFDLGSVKPGTSEFHKAHTPPPEQTIEVLGPKGPEGFGIIKRYDVTGVVELDDVGSSG